MPDLCDAKQLESILPSRECSLFDLDLLEAQIILCFIKTVKTRAIPLLVFLLVLLFEAPNILSQLF